MYYVRLAMEENILTKPQKYRKAYCIPTNLQQDAFLYPQSFLPLQNHKVPNIEMQQQILELLYVCSAARM